LERDEMPSMDRSIEELVDRLLTGVDSIEDLKKRRPKQPSFRYLRDKDEIQAVLFENPMQEDVSVMKTREVLKIVDENLAIVGIGNVEAIENIIKKHQASRKME